jgi:chemosensory pili system protein ChpA (sensor histidine kinase/response regulator)
VREAPPVATVLVVEDDAQVREFYRVVLGFKGYHVVSVEDGIDALRHIDSGTLPDLVILDLELPRLCGRDVKRELRAHAETLRIPILVITGVDVHTLNAEEFRCVIRKPITAEALIEAVDQSLRVKVTIEN